MSQVVPGGSLRKGHTQSAGCGLRRLAKAVEAIDAGRDPRRQRSTCPEIRQQRRVAILELHHLALGYKSPPPVAAKGLEVLRREAEIAEEAARMALSRLAKVEARLKPESGWSRVWTWLRSGGSKRQRLHFLEFSWGLGNLLGNGVTPSCSALY